MPRIVSPKRAFRDALGTLRREHTITIHDAERALGAIAHALPPLEQAELVQGFLSSRLAGQLSARAREALLAFITGAGTSGGANALDVRARATRETKDARANVKSAEAKLEELRTSSASTRSAKLAALDRALERARTDADDARTLLAKIASEEGVREAARSLGIAAHALDEAREALDALIARASRAPLRRADVDLVKRWLRAPTVELARAEAQLQHAPDDGRGGGFYTTAKAPSDSEDQGAFPPHGTGSTGPTGARSAIERMRRALAGATDDDEDDP